MKTSGYLWPVVDMRLKYVRPLRFQQTFIVTATLVETVNRLKIDYVLHDQENGEVLTKATTIQIAVDLATNELCLESPAALTNKVKVGP